MKRSMISFLASLSLSTLAMASGAQLRSVQSNGSGCPVQASGAIPYGFDGEWLTIDLSKAQMNVARGEGISLEESRRQCAFTLDLKAPTGYRFALERAISWGQMDVSDGDQLHGTLEAFFAGAGSTNLLQASAEGSDQNSFTFDRTLNPYDLNWSDCHKDRSLVVNTAIRVSNNAAPRARYQTYSAATEDKLALKFVFQKCH